jgi:hypothetical protein
MLAISQSESELIMSEAASGITDSDLGYFSKPFRISFRNNELMLKKYFPVKNPDIVSAILQNHDRYISALSRIGIQVPETIIRSVNIKGKCQIFILQEAFGKDELLRTRFEISPEQELLNFCKLIYDDVLKFISYPKESMDIGFHPTLRNYALHNGTLYFFDTFPPMLMNQRELNRIIIRMSPFGSYFKIFIPAALVNMVTNEYYNFEKMFTGITGSCCRLRPEHANAILRFSTDYINNSSCTTILKQKITRILKTPPELPGLWTFFRKLSGNVGKPNIRKQ